MLEEKVEFIREAEESASGTPGGAGPVAPKGWVNWLRCKMYDVVVAPLMSSHHPPWYDARGASLGLVVGFAVPVGGQIIALGFLRSFFRFNLIIAVGFSLVSNPFNMIPLYYGYYCLGEFVLGRNVSMDLSVFQKLMHPISESTYFWEAMAAFGNLGKEFLTAWIVAAIILSVTSGIIGYVVTHRIQKARCIRKARKMGLEYEKLLQDLEKQTCHVEWYDQKRR